MGHSRGVSRRYVLTSLFAASTALARVASVGATGAHSGPWCRELTKVAQTRIFDFTLRLLDGDDDHLFSLSALIGRPVWLQFFASWCGPCNREAADIVRIAAKYGDAIHAVGVDVGEDVKHARRFRDAHGIPFSIALDERSSVFHTFGFQTLPTHVFIDSQGLISCISSGDLEPDQMDNEVAVAAARVRPTTPRDAATSGPAAPGD